MHFERTLSVSTNYLVTSSCTHGVNSCHDAVHYLSRFPGVLSLSDTRFNDQHLPTEVGIIKLRALLHCYKLMHVSLSSRVFSAEIYEVFTLTLFTVMVIISFIAV